MSTDQLQLRWIPELRQRAQPLPPDVRDESIEVMARMLLELVRRGGEKDAAKESCDEPR